MRYPPEETAEKHRRILEQAGRLFRERGFSGVSVSEIMKATGLTHGPFYNHFASKEALMSEALADLSARTLAFYDRTVQEQGVAAYRDFYLSRAHVDDPSAGCLVAALATDIPKEPATRAPFTEHVKRTLERMTFDAAGDGARERALQGLSAMVGAVILARAVDDPALADEILAAVRECVGKPGDAA